MRRVLQKSLILDKGSYEKVAEDDEGTFYLQDGLDNPELVKVADGKVVKANYNHSFWYLTKIYRPKMLYPQSKLIFFGRNVVLTGRRKLKASQKIVVGELDELSLKEELHSGERQLDKTKIIKEDDIEFSIHTDWENEGKRNGNEVKSIGDYKKKDIKKATRIYEDKVVKSTNQGSVEKVNNQRDGLFGLYRNSQRDPHIKILRKKDWIYNTFESAEYDERNDVMLNPMAKERIKTEGELWSAGMSDRELRDYLVKNGIAEEKRRQDFALKNRIGSEAFIRYTWNTAVNYTDNDQNNQGQGYSFVFGYEYHLIRSIETLENWSVDVFWELGLDYYDLGQKNGKAQLSLLGGFINYYFYNLPTSVKQFIWYGGVGMKFGSASIENPDLNSSYSYSAQAFPTYQVGIKYRFDPGDEISDYARIGWGVNFLFQTSLLNFNTSDQLLDDIDGSFQAQDTRFAMGLVFVF